MIEAFESTLLGVFGLKERPRPKGRLRVPHHMKDLYKTHTEAEDGIDMQFNFKHISTGTANTIRSFHHEGQYLIKIKSHSINYQDLK